MYGRISFGPSAQLMPTESSGACETEIQKASTVWPERLRPERSVIVTEAMTGRRVPRTSNARSTPARAAFAFRVSKAVSTRRRSAPPSRRPSACSWYASSSSAKVTERAPGSFTSRESEAVLLVGPSAPATHAKRPFSAAMTPSTAWRAARAAATLMS